MDKDFLFEDLSDEEKVELTPARDGSARTVTVRSLSKAEFLRMSRRKDWDDPAVAERVMLVAALVDPVIDVNDAQRWQEADTKGDIRTVLQVIGEISGLGDDALKASYKSADD